MPLVLGVVAGAEFSPPRAASICVLGVSWLACGLALWRGHARAVVAAAVAGCLAAGAAIGARAIEEARHPSLLAWFVQFPRDRPVRLTGILREDARIGGFGVTLIVGSTAVEQLRVNGGLRVAVAGAGAPRAAGEWRAGRRLAMQVMLREPLDYRNPGV